MTNHGSSVEQVTRIAAGKENARKIPREIIRIYEERFAGFSLPKERSQKRDFLRSVIGIRNNVLVESEHVRQSLSNENAARLYLNNIFSVLEICELACRFPDPNRYARFLTRPGLSVMGMLLSMPGFAAGREIRFEEVPEDKRLMGRHMFETFMGRTTEGKDLLGKLLRAHLEQEIFDLMTRSSENENPYSKILIEAFQNKNMRVIHSFLKTSLEQYGIYYDGIHGAMAMFTKKFSCCGKKGYVTEGKVVFPKMEKQRFSGVALDTDFLISHDADWLIQHEVQHLFDRIIFYEPTWLTEEMIRNGELSQKEQEALFEVYVRNEYRAYIAMIAFAIDPPYVYSRNLYAIEKKPEVPEDLVGRLESRNEIGLWRAMNDMKQMLGAQEHPSAVADAAFVLLNRDYQELCGLTYEEILEPFRKTSQHFQD